MKSFYVLAFLLVLFTARGQTYIPAGFVSGTWESAQSPYYIQGNIEIHYDSTLVIESGVEVLFDGSYKLTVHGLLDASGTEADSILFTAVNPATGWQGIEFIQINEDLGISNVKYCTLSHGRKPSGSGGAIYVYQAENVLISHCLIMHNYADEGGGIYIDDGWIIVEYCLITHNSANSVAGGIACISSVPYFNNLEITYNTSGDAGGVYFAINPNYSWPFFDYLTITNNEGGTVGGLLLESSNTLVLNYCKITNNRGTYVGGIALIGSSFEIWSPYEKNQVYMNTGGLAQELYSEGGQSTNINIDTFTVINPDSYHVYPLDKFHFGDDGILFGLMEQADTNLFISETGSDTNDGLTPESPLRSFEYALRRITSDTAENNTLWVMPGHYHLTESESSKPIYLKNDVKIKATVPGEAILDGDSTCRVLFGYYKNNFSLSGLTFQNGSTEYILGAKTRDNNHGGGLYLVSSKGTIDSCKLISNYATWFGGGVYLGGNTNINFTNSEFIQNMAEYGGGGVDLDANNSVNFHNCKFIQNTAEYGGGGLLTNPYSSGPLLINECLFSENHSGEEGGGLTYSGYQISVKNSQFIANTSVSSGAGCYCDVSAQLPGFINCLFSKNISENKGGAIYFIGSTVSKLINCTFSDNQAVSGSAVYQVYLYKLYCINTIFWNSAVPTTDLIHVKSTGYPATTGFYTNYSDIQGGEASIVVEDGGVHWEEGNITGDPEFVDPSNDNYSLNWNSPCIEAGKEDTTGLNLPEYDLSGNPRIVNPRVDMGAYEFQMPVSVKPPFFANNRVRIYPAITDHEVNIEFPAELWNEKIRIRFYFSDGKMLKSVDNNTGDRSIKIDVSDLSAGVYIIVIEDDKGGKYSERMIIAR
jgi:predicted outer membrane repeat protein